MSPVEKVGSAAGGERIADRVAARPRRDKTIRRAAARRSERLYRHRRHPTHRPDRPADGIGGCTRDLSHAVQPANLPQGAVLLRLRQSAPLAESHRDRSPKRGARSTSTACRRLPAPRRAAPAMDRPDDTRSHSLPRRKRSPAGLSGSRNPPRFFRTLPAPWLTPWHMRRMRI